MFWVPDITATSRNGDNKNGDMPKRRQALVKTATTIGQNGEEFRSKRRQSLVKTATVVSQNGDSSQSTFWFIRQNGEEFGSY